jgi:hypothetical protein
MRTDRTRIRRPGKTRGDWIAHCGHCDHLMRTRTFEAMPLMIALHRTWTPHPAPALPQRRPGESFIREAPASVVYQVFAAPLAPPPPAVRAGRLATVARLGDHPLR